MRIFISGMLCMILSITLSGQTFFQPISESDIPANVKSAERGIIPQQYYNYQADHEALYSYLQKELSLINMGKTISLDFPIAPTQLANFSLKRVNNFHPDLSAKYPEIGSYEGRTADGIYTIRFAISPWNFFATIYTVGEGYSYLEPYSSIGFDHLVYYKRSEYLSAGGFDFICGSDEVHFDNNDHPAAELNQILLDQEKDEGPIELRTYRIAIACVGEFTTWNAIGGVPQALAKINESLDILNGIYNEELAVRFELIANNDQIIYTDSNTDPYIMVNDGGGLLTQNQDNLEVAIGVANFDIGHVFTRGCNNGLGGIAQRGSVCNNNSKARGVTCWANNSTNIVTSIAVHEIGHSFDSPHSWNKCPGSDDQRAPETAYEPGSGSTIMSYAGACGSVNNIVFENDIYFNIGSLEYMYRYRNTETGSTCGTLSDMNEQPDIDITSPGGTVIPLRTPFKLSAVATDMDGDNLNYCWEQHDLGPETDLGVPVDNGPSFRSYPPVSGGSRVFPRWSRVLNNSSDKTEVLATYEREYEFTVTVRDDNLPAGGISFDTINFSATEIAGPFVVSSPLATDVWEAGTVETVNWDVANTDIAPVNCQTVNIVLSTAGSNFNTVLAAAVPNTGSAQVLVPDITSTGARILVESVGNIFFDVNPGAFEIVAATGPGLSLGFLNINDGICLPGQLTYAIETAPLNGYANAVTYAVTGLPTGATATFSPNPAMPTDDLSLTIDFDATVPNGDYNLMLTANGTDLTELTRNFTVNALSQDFSGLALMAPADEATGVEEVPTLTWSAITNAETYDVQLSANPAFDPANTFEATATTLTSFSPSQALMKNTLYYWRVRGSNICAVGEWTEVRVFHTINFACSNLVNDNLSLQIPASSGTVTNTFDVNLDGNISDLNVSYVDLDFRPLTFVTIELESPGGIKETLFAENCSGADQRINIGFDSQAPLAIACPPDDGGLYLPEGGNLDNYNNTGTMGEWKLNITVDGDAFDPGTLNRWALEVCSNFTPSAINLDNNNVLEVKTGDAQWIHNGLLKSSSAGISSNEMVYTLVSLPEFGVIEAGGTNLSVGGTFTQRQVDTYAVRYAHSGSTETTDNFLFTVTNGAGGFIGTTQYDINVDDDNPVQTGIQELDLSGISLYPNPVTNELFVSTDKATAESVLAIIDNQGRTLYTTIWKNGNAITLNTTDLPNGLYYLKIQQVDRVGTKKFTVIR